MEHLDLPAFAVPETAPKPVTLTVFVEWLKKNMEFFERSVDVRRIRDQPDRRPADARFVLK